MPTLSSLHPRSVTFVAMRIKMITLVQSITIVDLQLVEQSQVNMPKASTAPHPFLFETVAQHLDDECAATPFATTL